MTEHRAEVWRDETAPVGGLFAWRSRCTCMGTIADRDWKPSWTARNHADALAVADHHVRQPRSDDWLNLDLDRVLPIASLRRALSYDGRP